MVPIDLKCYAELNETDVISPWYGSIQDEAKAELDGVLEILSSLSPQRWPLSCAKELSDRTASECSGLHEVLLDGPGYCYRIIGFLGPGAGEFTMLYPFDKQIDAGYGLPCKIAQERMKNVRKDWRLARIRWNDISQQD
jgi:hypothetical protein